MGEFYTYVCSVGWLRKAWEVLTSEGVLVVASEKWSADQLRPHLDKW